ncbi:hypothetical protein [Litchfieldia salsa]|uniref:Uncharacterized protein n=1 Tax=Litchfieldia salsa TaxID=930152 RepID=A0A1H0UDF6_9BACI|nr:hypothetical protein [Litchfieldia salsa]SDP64018.1 hypothetical protein SAMN05216565_104311 [Litchfieldia salsa]
MKSKMKILMIILFCSIVMFSTVGINQRNKKTSTLFSWSIENKAEKLIENDQKPLNINRVFQYIYPNEFVDGTLTTYVRNLNKQDLSVYAMDGGYYWGTTDYGYEELTNFVDQVAEFNSIHENEMAIEGIVFDVEPAQDENWKDNENELMKHYVDNMIKAYEYASNKGLVVVICITYWYDEKHLSELRRLIKNSCDEVAVMNYYRGKEIDHIKTEVAIAKEYNKPIMNIFEFDKPDNKAIFDQNTYYDQGPDAAQLVFEEIDAFFNYEGLTAGWHQLK